ncbi:hypothetical protein GCM10009827_070120 [Dactylosporangium maewongense]|uniref:Uncharacterized protein n=1 Tax=Dactylosporangium maewongense TaxID=634393 RepID=A0ABP4MEA2_9ACTN
MGALDGEGAGGGPPDAGAGPGDGDDPGALRCGGVHGGHRATLPPTARSTPLRRAAPGARSCGLRGHQTSAILPLVKQTDAAHVAVEVIDERTYLNGRFANLVRIGLQPVDVR